MAELAIAVLAGILAGVGTGFAGLSAAVFIAPMLIAFLGVDSFSAIGIALASDVLASAASALTYAKHGNIDLKRGRTLMITIVVSAIAGTVASHFLTGFSVGESIMGIWLILATFVLGAKLLFFPAKGERGEKSLLPLPDGAVSVLCGIYIGFVCGFQGTGGGLMMLFVLNILLGMEFRKAVGTSVLIMTFTALIGAVSHFLIRGLPDGKLLLICIISTFLAAEAAAAAANRMPSVRLKRITGALMTAAGIAMLAARFL